MNTKLALTCVLVLSAMAGCCKSKPVPGGKCKVEGEASCPDPQHFLHCQSGTWQLDPCKGPKGCAQIGQSINCDQSLGDPGDPCSQVGGAACSPDKKKYLECDGHTMVEKLACQGPEACHFEGKMAHCDQSLADIGSKCDSDKAASCSLDHKSFLKCTNNAFALALQCRGPKGCYVEGKMIKCDQTVLQAGDPCTEAGGHGCSADGKQMIECKGGKYVVDHECKRKPCTISGDRVTCQ